MLNYTRLISEAKLFFYNGELDKALEFTDKAIQEQPNNEDAYLLAGQISLSLADANAAAKYFSDLVRINSRGDYYYLLGQAQAMNSDGMNAIVNFERAIQKGCSPENKGKIYKIMAMLNVEMGNFEDGLKNIENASVFVDLDLDLIKSRFLCYSGLEDFKNAVAACNQMKLISPSSYEAYSMSFEILMKLEMYDEAERELNRAFRSIKPLPQMYFDDQVKFLLTTEAQNGKEPFNDELIHKVLKVYAKALDNLYNTSSDFDSMFSVILRGAQAYLQIKDGHNALRLARCLLDIPSSYIRREPLLESKLKTEEELEELYNSEFFATLGTLSFDERTEEFEKLKERLTPLDKISQGAMDRTQKNEANISYKLSDDQKEVIWGVELSAYDLLHEYESEMKVAECLQGSNNTNSSYLGKYSILRCQKFLECENWRKNYENAVGFWKNRRLVNPDDLLALPYQIRCLIDLGRFDEAERLIEKLPADNKTILSEILKEEMSRVK